MDKMKKQKIIVVVGANASGKSALAVALAQRFGGEVISADSRQVYRGLNIATGKITAREMQGVPHHLIDVASPKRTFTAYDFALRARSICSNILQNDKIPIIVGGTGFYIDALLGRTSLPDVPPDKKLRTRLEKKTATQLIAQLKRLSPKRAQTLVAKGEQNNKRRLIRAIEIAGSKSKAKFLDLPMMDLRSPSFEVLWVGLKLDDDELKKRIHKRTRERMRRGMVAEARRLHERSLSWKRMEELGLEYRHLADYLRGRITKGELIANIERDDWRYAKRQRTWFKRNKEIRWFHPDEEPEIRKAVKGFLGE
ncbi:MAG: tRNA (adenosine(37)-N6)-dimethylallyltransferase MiaA [bacterium]|nr:tRNA (adenosine(37)-N6)-dimethylallyltransferase MiaA [bacterium]